MPPEGFDLRTAWATHRADLLGFAVNALRDRGAAEDCVQETFVRAWQARERFDPARGSERTWLFAIVRNVVLDQVRARHRRATTPVAELDDVAAEDRDISRIEDHVTLVWALAQLSQVHREVVVAVRLEGMTYEQLARRLKVPAATLRTRMFHGLRALREILEREEGR